MKYNLKRPCKHCPFRNDIRPFLRPDRAEEIADSLVRGEFPCHETLDYSDCGNDSAPQDTEKTAHCAGALIMLEHMERPSQMMRICERLGMYDHRQLDMTSPVFTSADDFIHAQTE